MYTKIKSWFKKYGDIAQFMVIFLPSLFVLFAGGCSIGAIAGALAIAFAIAVLTFPLFAFFG